jgi:hypothetical protein
VAGPAPADRSMTIEHVLIARSTCSRR